MEAGLHYAYTLLEEIYSAGFVSSVELAKDIPEFAAFVPVDTHSEEHLRELHYRHFDYNIPPVASMFLDGYRGDSEAKRDELFRLYRALDFDADASFSADHIVTILAGLDRSIQYADGNVLAEELLRHHLLPWLSPFCIACRISGNTAYYELARTTLRVGMQHYSIAGDAAHKETPSAPAMVELVELNDQTGLKDIVAHLVSHAQSGIYLSKDSIQSIARSLKLPTGFGSRDQMLLTTFRSAVEYEHVGLLVGELQAFANVWLDAYSDPEFSRCVAMTEHNWPDRIRHTRNMISQIASVIGSRSDVT